MNILMTTDTIGGVWTFTVDLIKALEPFKVHVLLASLGKSPTSDQLEEVKKLCFVDFESSDFKLEWMEDPWSDLRKAQKWILKLAANFKPDVVHLNSYSVDPALFEVPVVLTGHSCVTSWWQAVKKESLPNAWDPYFKAVRQATRNAKTVVAPSRSMLQNLIHFYGPFNKAEFIYNAGNPDFYQADAPKEQIIFSMGRIWDEAKNMKILIEAAKYQDIPVYIAGDYTNKNQQFEFHNVCFKGQLTKKEIAEWLAKSSVFVLPSLYEPFGLSALEAAYSGCALILADISSLHEIWGEAAVYFNPLKVYDLVDKLKEVNENENLRNELAQKAFHHSKLYRPEIMANKYYALYIN